MRDFINEAPIFSAIVGLVFLAMIAFTIDVFSTEKEFFTGELIDKHYQAERSSVGTGTAIGSNGSTSLVSTVEIDPEKFIFIVKDPFGKISTVKVSPNLFYFRSVGDQLECYRLRSKYFSLVYDIRINNREQ